MMEEDDEGFNLIQPSLIQQLKTILDQYPDDGQILKELIQNAEDAGATQVKFLHDKHSYGTEKLHSEGLVQFQGPALYAYNNAQFTKEDWRGIRMLCDSIKVKDPMKVGRFGLGFKSVFHVTDLPSMVSGSQIGVIDPHEEYFSDGKNRRTGYSWKIKDDRGIMDSIPDQFAPYKGIFECTKDVFSRGSYDGTLFRFPLRHQPSELSQTLYSAAKVHTLFEGFIADAHLVLLFLQHLESIELYVREESDNQPRKTFEVRITDESLQLVREKRKEFHNRISTGQPLPHPVHATYPITVETIHFSQGLEAARLKHSFLITNYFCGGEVSSEFQTLARDQSLNYLPLVGVAMALPASSQEATPAIKGHVFCFLPLPVQKTSLTGLPVHVNGFFALSQNRRYIKSPNAEQEDQERTGSQLTDKSLLWNKCLLEEALPKAYVTMVLDAINEKPYNVQVESIYRAWPNIDIIDQKWKRLQNPLLEALCSANVVYTKASGGKWLKVEDAIVDRLDDDQLKELLVNVLLEAQQKVATLPDHVLKGFTVRNNSVIKEITPMLVQQILNEYPSSYRNRGRMEKLKLLEFILNCEDENLPGLLGLELLPLSGGTFKSFSKCAETVYICSPEHPRKMFPCLDHQFLDDDLKENLVRRLQAVAKKGCSQLKLLSGEDVASLLPKSLPPGWSEGETIFWYHGSISHNHPDVDWLELVWNYLRKNFSKTEGLRRFGGLPLIPYDISQVPCSLARLQEPSKIVVKTLFDEFLDETLTQTLKELGVVIIQECPPFLALHPAVFNAFIHPPSPHGVLKALAACPSAAGSNMHSVTDEGKRSLRNFSSRESSLEPQAKQLLRSLPLFETLKKNFVSAEQNLCAAPEGSYPIAPRRDLIDVTHDDSKKLALLLDIRCLSPIEFFLEIVFPNLKEEQYSNEEIDRLMRFVMERYHVYAGIDAQFEGAMKSLPFVQCEHGRVRAKDLFDPRNELLKRMFVNEDVFPVGVQYTNPAALVVLQKIGMKDEQEITGDDLCCSARLVSQMSNCAEAKRKSETMLTYLDRNPKKLQQTVSGVPLAQHLRDIPWVSAVNERPFRVPASLHLFKETSEARFYKPTDVTSEDQVYLIGTVKPIVKVDSSGQLAKCFGWDKTPDTLDVVKHLKSVVRHYTQNEKPDYISIVKDIYSFLSDIAEPAAIQEHLKGMQNSTWIWNGDGFSSPDVILAERPPIDLTPFISSLPSDVLQFSNFFSKFGMRKHCDALFLAQVLHLIRQKYETGCKYPKSEVKRDLQLSADILNEIKPSVGEQLPSEIQEKVLIPTYVEGDSYVRLAPVKDCLYCDHEWLDVTLVDEERDCLFVHPNIPNSTADRLNVRTLRHQLLEADEMGEEFGQEEKLTRRLNRLLEEYTDGFSVPKELIQNADDAGATEVRFLYDERTNEDAMTCLIDEGMRECQGPALWVYNDADFRQEDFENITKLNGGTKEQETEKIGKFGLGFNTVYNLTDVPMFLSRNYLVIFDPNTFYLGKAIKNKSKPGIRIDLNKNPEKKRKFKNQFKPFNGIFGCDLHLNKKDNSFLGTLFRFPLRTPEQAVRSEIKKVHYDNSQMRELLEIFVHGAKTLLLFTQNVHQVSIFHLPIESTEQTKPKLMFQVTKSLSKAGIIRELSVPNIHPSHLRYDSKEDLYLLKQCNFLRASSEVAKHAVDTKQTSDNLLRSAFTVDITSNVTECGHSFFDDKDAIQSTSEVWSVASSMGKGQAMQYSIDDRSLLPAASVAVQLIPQKNTKFVPKPVVSQSTGGKLHHNGTVFCYLPLPIHCGLPVHINGAFAVASSRRHLRQKTEDDKACTGVEWNNVLLKDSVCAAYLDLLGDMKLAASTYSFYTLWPRACYIQPSFEILARSFYEQVASGSHSLFSDGKRWTNFNQVVLMDPYFRHDQQVGNVSFAVLQMFVKENEVVVDFPLDVFQSFIDYGMEEKIRLKTYDKGRFLNELFFPNIPSVPPEMRDKLVLNALDDAKGAFDELIETCACIPVSPGGKDLKCPAELVNPKKATASVFKDEDQRFPFGTTDDFLDPIRLAKLEKLGMVGDDPPWVIFEERAKSISILNDNSSKAASERVKVLIHLLERKLSREGEGIVLESVCNNLLRIKFLPVATKPEHFPFFWQGGNLRPEKGAALVSPKEAFQQSEKYLVCCSEPLVDLHINPLAVGKFLQLDKKKPTVQHVVTQLNFASRAEGNLDLTQFKEVKTTVLKAYEYLQTALNKKKIDENEVQNIFQDKRLILVGREFVHAKRVAFVMPVDCFPYLQKLPAELARQFRSLMKSAGAKETFEAIDFIKSLEEMKNKFKDKVLDKENLQIAVNLARQLGDYLKDCGKFDEKQQTVYLPDSQGIMQPACDLCVDDCWWITEKADVNFANNMIPHPTCIQLGVKTRRVEVLNRFAIGIPFGQHEKLTNRIQRLLKKYSCEKEVLKEILQNADDAGATELTFIKDPRQHRDERVFEDSWKPLQGPALCVYNNKPFTEADIKGIQNLGEGNKGDDPNKTGQYGVGFNAVYHLTDVPSLISSSKEIGDVLCVFDPHCQYMPGASPQMPGRMFREARKIRDMFPDVFACYMDEVFPMQNSTMFRFPVRTEHMAKTSQISHSPVTLEDLESMMEALKLELFEVLLFVKNVRKITLCNIDESGKVASCYFVEAKLSERDELKRQQFVNFVKQTGKFKRENADFRAIDTEVRQCSYVLGLKDSNGKEEKWLIVQQIGFNNKMRTNIADTKVNGDLNLLPQGGVACLLKESSTASDRGQGGKEEKEYKAYCFLPLPVTTGLPVHINGHFALDHETRRNLSTDKNDCSGVNWNNCLIERVVAPCYLSLLDELRSFFELPVPQNTELVTLGCSRDDLIKKLGYYERIFPIEGWGNPFTYLVTSVYQRMEFMRMRLFPVVRDYESKISTPKVQLKWLPPTGNKGYKAFFNTIGEGDCFSAKEQNTVNATEEEERTKKKTSFEHILLQTGFNLVAFKLSVYEAMKRSGLNPCSVSPSTVMEFYKSFSCEDSACSVGPIPVDVGKTPFQNVENVVSVLKYCKESEQFLTDLSGLPLLVTQDNCLQAFSVSNPKFLSHYHSILPQCKELFVHIHVLNTIFASDKSLNASVFKRFDVESFAVNLHLTLPRGDFNVDGYVKWCTGQKTAPNRDWIQNVWRFLNEETKETIKSTQETAANDEENTRSIQASYKINTPGNPDTQLSEEEEADIIQKLLAPLKSWAILPCKKAIRDGKATGVEDFLVPLGLGGSVLDFTDHDAVSFGLVVVLRKLSLAELNCSVLSLDSSGLARRLVASLKSPASLLTSFRYMLDINPCELEGKLKETECRTVLTFFSECVCHLKETDRNTLRQLPFYETTHGGLVNLHDKKIYVVPSEIPNEEMEVLERHCKVVFLLSLELLSSLFEFLDLKFISPIDLYCKFILNHFCLFSNEARRVHLEHIRDYILDSESSPTAEEKRILKCLTDTEIVPSKDGTLKKASCYYDHTNEVFSTMLTEEMFPPQPFKNEKWMSFLKTVGLIHEVSIDIFKQFATKVSREGATQRSASTESKSKVLVQHLFSRDKVLEEQLLPVVREISFVASSPVGQELRGIHRQFGEEDGQTPYIAFQGSVLQKDAEIAWTTAPILPEWADPSLSQYPSHCCILDELNVRTKPTVESVTFHCENVASQMILEDESEISPEQRSTRRTVMAKIYRFLQNEAISGTFVKDRLKDTPCILVEQGSRLVNVQQVVIELYANLQIKPYIYKMPAEYGEFQQFFQYLGCSLSVQLSHYARILDLLHEKCKENSLDENDEDISLKAVKGIFETVQDDSDGNHIISSLYLPAIYLFAGIEEERARPLVLRKADELLFDDAPHYHDRLRNFEKLFVVDLGRSHVRCNASANYKELVLLLPATLQPQMLSTAVEETFVESLDNTTFLDTGVTRLLKRMLHSEEFYRGILRLIRHENPKKLDEGFVASLKTTLKSIELHGMKKIVTNLRYKGRVIPGSKKEVSYFVERGNESGQENWNVYLSADVADEAANMSAIDLTLSQVIQDECKGLLQGTVLYIPLMLHSKPGKIGCLLDRMKIRQDNSGHTGRRDLFPEPGSFIPIADHHFLNPAFEPMEPAEYVGYEVEDPSLKLEDGDATYIYAIMIEEVASNATNLFSKSYKIDIGHEKIAWATDLYKLCRFQDMSSTAAESLKFQSVSEKKRIFDEISRTIKEVWRLPEDRRRKVIKRLFLQWHPNRNPGNETFCSQVCQHINNEIRRLEREASYDAFFYNLGERARQYNSSRQEYRQTYYQHYGSQTWEFPPSFCQRNPQPREAQRWFRQAEDDLAASRNDTETYTPSHVWACFKCHQAAEKALKAAQFAKDASNTFIHDLKENAIRVNDSQLINLSSQLEGLLGDSTRMRYPDRLSFPKIPKDVYTNEDAHRAIELATQIVQQVGRKFL